MAYPLLGTELINGGEVDSIIECAKKYEAGLLILGMRKHTLLMDTRRRTLPNNCPELYRVSRERT
jgi:hypothetical protein